jgi:hypothetical protein
MSRITVPSLSLHHLQQLNLAISSPQLCKGLLRYAHLIHDETVGVDGLRSFHGCERFDALGKAPQPL